MLFACVGETTSGVVDRAIVRSRRGAQQHAGRDQGILCSATRRGKSKR